MIWLHLLGHTVFVGLLGYYLATNLQWYNYKLNRIIIHHHRPIEHIFLFLLPLFAYFALREYVVLLDLIYGNLLILCLSSYAR